ncbi:hypothetical protein [Paenibacillus sp. FSL M7-0896]|uniref:hypothetical protein n=1 Tax=unclassified Paenibacillus TaxID=185978 RepID=UPI0030D7C1B2
MIKNKLHVVTSLLACTLLISACNSKDSIHSKNNTNISGNPSQQNGKIDSNSTENNKIIQIDGVSYTIPLNNKKTEKYNFAIKTSEGIVWSPSPKMDIAPGTETNPYYFPTAPFSFYLSSPDKKALRIDKAKKLFTLPLHDGKANLVVDEVFGLGDYIIYHTSSVFSDGAQPLRQQAWVMRIDNPTSNKEILEFHSTGGKSYSYAVDEKERLYVSVSVIPGNADGSDSYEVYVYNISTDKKEKVQNYSLNKPSIDSIQFNYNEKKYSYKLHAK